MNVLGLDTCFPALSVAVGLDLATPAARVLSRTEPMQTGHAERLLPLIDELLSEAGTLINSIDRIAVTIGPGSFTGTRIGIAAARALKLALDVPIVAFTSLEAMALSPSIDAEPGEDLVIAVDAHRGEAYVQVFDAATRLAKSAPTIVPFSEFAAIFRGRPVISAGTAATAVAAAVRSAGGEAQTGPVSLFPDMAAAVSRAPARLPASELPAPLYLRPPDAKPQDGKSLPRAGG